MNQFKNVYAYLRISSGRQDSIGLIAQLDACEKWVLSRGLLIRQVFVDKGVSGAAELSKRPSLLQLLSLIRKNDVLLIAKWDRIGREELSVAAIESAVKERGAHIVSAAGEGTDERDELSSFVQRRIAKFFAEYERIIIRLRTRQALQAKRERRERIGHIPFGFRLASDGIHLEEDPQEQKILQEILALRAQGLSVRNIAKELNERKIFNRHESKWNHASVHRKLQRFVPKRNFLEVF